MVFRQDTSDKRPRSGRSAHRSARDPSEGSDDSLREVLLAGFAAGVEAGRVDVTAMVVLVLHRGDVHRDRLAVAAKVLRVVAVLCRSQQVAQSAQG